MGPYLGKDMLDTKAPSTTLMAHCHSLMFITATCKYAYKNTSAQSSGMPVRPYHSSFAGVFPIGYEVH